MRQMKWMSGFIVLLLLCMSALPALAQQDLPQTYSDDVVTISYPEDWFKCTCPDDENTFALGNTEEAPYSEDLQRDEVQILVVKSAMRFMDEMFETELIAETPEDVLIYFNFAYDEMDIYEFDDARTAAVAFMTNRETRLESMFVAMDLGDGEFGMFIATTRLRSLGQFEDTILEIASTFVAVETEDNNSSTGSKGGSLRGLGGSKRGDKDQSTGGSEIELTEVLELEDASFEFAFPEDWMAFEDEGVVILINDEAVLELSELTDLKRGEALVFIYPTLDTLSDYSFPIDDTTRPSTIVSYYASMAMVYGIEQQGAMGVPVIGEDEVLASDYYGIMEGEYDEYVLAMEDGEGDIITVKAYTAPGEMPQILDVLHAIAGSFSIP